jgi:hypothetical protein
MKLVENVSTQNVLIEKKLLPEILEATPSSMALGPEEIKSENICF